MAQAFLYLKGNSMLLGALGLQNKQDSAFFNAATVAADLVARGETSVITNSGISLTYVAASDGDYYGTYPITVSVTEGQRLTARITAIESGVTGYWELDLVVRLRQS